MPSNLVEYVLRNLVEDPSQLRVTSDEGARGVRIEVRCAKADAGRIIGRNGRIINAVRTLARAAADGRQRVDVHLID
ncbi:MAG: KH domain-containing protein [Trueperaceae bacterium]|nr:KH domain-containing protein [Trueperaceae bacterium]